MTSSGIALQQRVARPAVDRVWPSSGIFSIGWACIVFLVVLFELHAGAAEVWLVAVPVLVCIFVLQLSAAPLSLSLLAGALLLGPIARILLPGGLLLHLGDIGIGAVALASLVRYGQRAAIPLGGYQIPILLIIVFVLLSWIAGLDSLASTPSMVALLEMLALYVFTSAAVTNSRDADTVILGWAGAVALGAVLVTIGYLRREPLLLGAGIGEQKKALSTVASTTYLFRGTFFVTGFGYPLAAAILCSTMWIVAKKGSLKLRLGLLAGLIVDIVALGLMGGATVGGAVAIGMIFLAFWTLWLPKGLNRVMALTIVVSAVAGAIAFALGQIMSSAQLNLLLGRAQSADSLLERFKVWKTVVGYLLTNSHALLLGLGPDISIRRGDYDLLRHLFNGAGSQQNAVDSGYLYLLLNYGIFVFLLVVGIAIHTLARLTKLITYSPDPTLIAIWISIVVWMVMAITQQGGVSKPLFVTAQFTALGTALYATSTWRTRTP